MGIHSMNNSEQLSEFYSIRKLSLSESVLWKIGNILEDKHKINKEKIKYIRKETNGILIYQVYHRHENLSWILKIEKRNIWKLVPKILPKDKLSICLLDEEYELMKLVPHKYITSPTGSVYKFKDRSIAFMIIPVAPENPFLSNVEERIRFQVGEKRDLEEEQVQKWMAQIVLAIDALHKKNLVYGLIHPRNILIDKENNVKLLNLMNAHVDGYHPKSKVVHRYIGYIAPEIYLGKPYQKNSDWYSIGMLLYDLLVEPFVSHTFKEYYLKLQEQSENDESKVSSIPPVYLHDLLEETADFIESMVQTKPEDRLGANGVESIKKHKYFEKIDWKELEGLNEKKIES